MAMRLVVGISGASGVIYGIEILRILKEFKVETHLILTEAAKKNIEIETDYSVKQVEDLATIVYPDSNCGARPASGSFIHQGMIVSPCTIKTLSGIANSYDSGLLVRAADVTLKEKRKLVLMVRETPLHKGHLSLMMKAADLGALILPPTPAFYQRPAVIQDIINQTLGKALDYFEIGHELFRRWDGV